MSVTVVGQNTSTTANTTLPVGTQAGDLCYFFDSTSDTAASFDKSGDGWGAIFAEANFNHWQALWHKVLTETDITQGHVTGYNGGTMAKGLVVFRTDGVFASVVVSGLQRENTANNPAEQTINPAGGSGATRIVCGWSGSNNTHTESGTLTTAGTLVGTFTNRKTYFEIQEGSFTSRTYDMNDGGNNLLATWFFDITAAANVPVLVQAGLTAGAVLARGTGKSIATVTRAGVSVAKSVAARLSAALDGSATAVKAVGRLIAAPVSVLGAASIARAVLLSAGVAARSGAARAVGKIVAVVAPLTAAFRKAVAVSVPVQAIAGATVLAQKVFLVFVNAGVTAAVSIAQAARRLLFKAGLALGLSSGATGAHAERGRITRSGASLGGDDSATGAHPSRADITGGGPGIGRTDTLFD